MKRVPNLAVDIIKIIGDYTIGESRNEEVIDIEEIPDILRMIASDYQNWIDSELLV